ncbi:RagB/SusD family nutrient uptake outer membrane protein [Fodinibius halophilus]|uniref:RagB/SusD family nutrient uptake outer membrane protein n=1 Tax=Fodinibius halophilus TaxID=1736908 RepID=A0A6M1TGU6_9BACT|nr:RagB/SusD family nutrient uptake outer membrane protein [Fodinibius halophilus]NGP87870.1 RagB/SusD family nutrient uptake outer membrane protein [Fodinibius halophilus]
MNIMRYLNKLLILALLATTIWSCDDQLTTSPYDSIDSKTAYETVDDLEQGALGAYNAISGVNIYGINARITDNLRRADSNTGQGMQIFNHNIIAGDGTIGAAWLNAYIVIDRVNRLLAASEEFNTESTEQENTLKQIRGEMLALRAYQHFDLFRMFASYDNSGPAVPYMVESKVSSPARTPKAEFFNLLIEDIDNAITLLGQQATTNNDRLNLRTVQGLRARVALYRSNWSTAIDYATQAIDNPNSSGLTSRSNYAGLWDDSIQGEVMFKLLRPLPSSGTVDIFERASNDDVFFYASNELANLYDTSGDNDIRFNTFFERIDSETVKVNKYNKRNGQKNTADIKMMRISEMYLIRAEAYAQPGPQQDLTAAEDDIKELRANRYDTVPQTSFSDSQDALDTIRLERRLELVYEGHHFFDLKRANLPITRIPADIDAQTASDGLAADSYKFVLPIPIDEIFANENIEQNPGY